MQTSSVERFYDDSNQSSSRLSGSVISHHNGREGTEAQNEPIVDFMGFLMYSIDVFTRKLEIIRLYTRYSIPNSNKSVEITNVQIIGLTSSDFSFNRGHS